MHRCHAIVQVINCTFLISSHIITYSSECDYMAICVSGCELLVNLRFTNGLTSSKLRQATNAVTSARQLYPQTSCEYAGIYIYIVVLLHIYMRLLSDTNNILCGSFTSNILI